MVWIANAVLSAIWAILAFMIAMKDSSLLWLVVSVIGVIGTIRDINKYINRDQEEE